MTNKEHSTKFMDQNSQYKLKKEKKVQLEEVYEQITKIGRQIK